MMRTGDSGREKSEGERRDIRELSDPYVPSKRVVHVGNVVDEVLSTASVPVEGNKVDLQ